MGGQVNYIVISKDEDTVSVFGPFDTPEQARAWQASVSFKNTVVDILIKTTWNAC